MVAKRRVTFENRPASAPPVDEFGRRRVNAERPEPSIDEVKVDNQLRHEIIRMGFHRLEGREEPLHYGVFHVAALNEMSVLRVNGAHVPVLRIEYFSLDKLSRTNVSLGPMIGQWISSRASQIPGGGQFDQVLLLVQEPLQASAISILEDFSWCKWMTLQDFLASTREQVLSRFAKGPTPTSSTTEPSVLTATASIPASDRIVRINDNDPTASALIDSAAEVANELATSNSLPVEAEERLVLLREVQGLLGQLQSKVVRLGALQAAVSKDGILGYLKGRFPDHVMSGLVGTLITAIGAWIFSLF